MKKRFLILLGLCYLANTVLAHGDLDERIIALSKKIEIHPDSAILYMLRGELHYQHEEYKKAIRDLKRCARRGGGTDRLHYDFAQSYHQRGRFRKALRHLDDILTEAPQHVRALRLKGQLLMDKKKFCEAGLLFEDVLENVKTPLTENFLEAATAWEKCSKPTTNQRAVSTIENGIEILGPLLAFFNRLKEIALRQNQVEEAIKQQTHIITYSIRKEKPFYERALLFVENSNKEKARKDLIQSRNLLNNLPIKFQKTEAMKDLQRQVGEALLLLEER